MPFVGVELTVHAVGELVPAPAVGVAVAPRRADDDRENPGCPNEVVPVLERQSGRYAIAVDVANTEQAPAALGGPSADDAVHLRRHAPETGCLNDAVPGGDDDGVDGRGRATGADPEHAALVSIASGPLDRRERGHDRGLIQLPDVDAGVRLHGH